MYLAKPNAILFIFRDIYLHTMFLIEFLSFNSLNTLYIRSRPDVSYAGLPEVSGNKGTWSFISRGIQLDYFERIRDICGKMETRRINHYKRLENN